MHGQIAISEAQVRYLYPQHYLPLLACHERQPLEQLRTVSDLNGLLLTLDGLAPEGGEAHLWVIRELRTGLTVRSGWMSQQDQTAFENVLSPIAESGLTVSVVLSDKQRGLLPAIPEVFPRAKHAFCHSHSLKNLAEPIAEWDNTMKVTLRKTVRESLGATIRTEQVDAPGVLTVTGVLPSGMEGEPTDPPRAPAIKKPVLEETREHIVTVIQQKIRYLLTLKGRPPFRLAGIEMYERWCEVNDCVRSMLDSHHDQRLSQIQHGLEEAFASVRDSYVDLHQAELWLEQIAEVLDPEGKPERSGAEVRQELGEAIARIRQHGQGPPVLNTLASHLAGTTEHDATGLFYTYDIEELPRTNNDRESEFRRLTQRLLRTTGQQGATRRTLLRSGAWETIPPPDTIEKIIEAFGSLDPEALHQERQRIQAHRTRFKSHTRSVKQSRKQLEQLKEQWEQLNKRDVNG